MPPPRIEAPPPPPPVMTQMADTKDYGGDFSQMKEQLRGIEVSVGGLRREMEQQAEDQEEFQAVTMEAIKKIYEGLANLNGPMPPLQVVSPRRTSLRNEELSGGEDRGLFTPPTQMHFEKSSSGNGGTVEQSGRN